MNDVDPTRVPPVRGATLSFERITQIAERAAKATPGPWNLTKDGRITQTSHFTRDVWTIPTCDEDLPFIAHARTDIPDLLAALSESQAETARLKAAIEKHREATFHDHRTGFLEITEDDRELWASIEEAK